MAVNDIIPISKCTFRFGMKACSSSLLLLLGACAIVPESSDLPAIKTEAHYASTETFAAPKALWPSKEWWLVYRDPQLNELMSEGLAGATDIKVAAARLMAADAIVGQEKSSLYPSVNLAGEAGATKQSYNYIIPGDFAPRGWKQYGQLTTNLQWDLDFWGRNRSAFIAALSERDAAEAEAAAARLNVSAGIAQAYANLASLYAQKRSSEAAIAIREATFELMQKRFALNLENRGAVDRAKSSLSTSKGNLALIEEDIALVKNQLAALMGAGPDRAKLIGAPSSEAVYGHGLPDDITINLIAHRPDIIASRYRVEAAAARIKVAKAAFYPNFSISALVGLQSLGLDNLFKSGSTFGTAGPALDLPLFDAGARKGRFRQAEATYAEAVETYNGQIIEALHQVSDAATSYEALQERMRFAQEAEASAQAAWRVARDRYEGGLASYLEVLTAEDALISTKQTVSILEVRGFAVEVSLTRALGGGYLVKEGI